MTKLTTAITGAFFALGVFATSANALTNISFTAVVTGGENVLDFSPNPAFNGATGTGSITFDETLPQTDFFDGDLDFSLTMFGQTFSSTDDEVGTALYDSLTGYLFFSVNEAAFINPVDIVLAGLEGFAFSSPITPVLGGGNEVAVYAFAGDGTCNAAGCALTPVPVPASLPLLLGALGLVGWTARRAA